MLEYSIQVAGTPTWTTRIKIIEDNIVIFVGMKVVQGEISVAYSPIQTLLREGIDMCLYLVGQGDEESRQSSGRCASRGAQGAQRPVKEIFQIERNTRMRAGVVIERVVHAGRGGADGIVELLVLNGGVGFTPAAYGNRTAYLLPSGADSVPIS